jgi:hypothetical protein
VTEIGTIRVNVHPQHSDDVDKFVGNRRFAACRLQLYFICNEEIMSLTFFCALSMALQLNTANCYEVTKWTTSPICLLQYFLVREFHDSGFVQ